MIWSRRSAGEERVVVQLHDEGDPVHVLARHDAESAKRRCNRAALAASASSRMLSGSKYRELREARRGGVLDALVDRKDREVAASA